MGEREKIVLFKKKEQCCGCGACMNICPKQAITMIEDEYGFLYPHIDYEKCVSCGACKSVCSFQNTEESNKPIASYAAVNKDSAQKIISASGGLFAAMATNVISDGGIVFGCAMDFENDKAVVHHIAVDKLSDLPRLQGSKYVQSSTGFSYKEVLSYLSQGRMVLYSGTPCQIAGLKGFLKKDYPNLILVDLVCHGVPNVKFFNDYLNLLKIKNRYRKIIAYSFRDKKKGWGENCRIDVIDSNGKKKIIYTPARLDLYNSFFLDALSCRLNCYSCKYTCNRRPGDITIGDYWGIYKEHPDIINKDGFEEKYGISCLIANSEKGIEFLKHVQNQIDFCQSDFCKISRHNEQLNYPHKKSDLRDIVMDTYLRGGGLAVEKLYKKKYFKKRIIHFIYNKIPRNIRNCIKKIK